MGEVCLVEHVVGAEDVERHASARLFEPERRVDLTVEVLARPSERELWVFLRGTEVGPLPVERFEEVGNPPDSAFDRHEVEFRKSLTYSRRDQLDYVTRICRVHLDGVL